MKSAHENLLAAVRRTLEEAGLTAGETLVVAVSGGPDSTALLHALAALCSGRDLRLVGAHLNHGFRGAEAEGDAAYAQGLCERLNVPFVGESIDVPALQRRRHLSAQAAAREVRHTFLRKVAAAVGARYIALGHNRDDRIETVLLNILRGSGLEGLAGLTACDPPLVRPLLSVPRAEIEAYCVFHALQPRQDSSNQKTDYTRNRMRAELLPHLASYYNQCVGDSLLRLSELAIADSELLECLAREALQTVTMRQDPEECVLDAARLSALPLALKRRVLRLAIAAVRGDLRDIGMETTERILRALALERTEAALLPMQGAVAVEVALVPPAVHIRRRPPAVAGMPWRCALPVPGRVDAPRAGLVLETAHCSSWDELCRRALPEQQSLIYALSDVVLPLSVRSWRAGDRLRPYGLNGTKKLQDLFTDRKIRREERLRFPVLVDATERVLAVLGLDADETALRISVGPPQQDTSDAYIVLTWSQGS
jgi:tRNA(Ile)-lysidine synthase